MKNYFYSNEIAEHIKTLLDENLPTDAAKNITVGDFSVLPDPDTYNEYLPAVIISANEMTVTSANLNRRIFHTPYNYTIYYLTPYTFEQDSDAVTEAKTNAEAIANILISDHTLDQFEIYPTYDEAGGQVVTSELSRIRYDSAEQAFFRELRLAVSVASIDFTVDFRTFAKEAI